ncbi:Retrovirus-related Pol polyprotein, partial [Mucuna pruriens]
MNLTIMYIVKKEVTKLLTAGIIYPISDSQWVSLVQVVPKKSEITESPIIISWMDSPNTCKSTLHRKINTRLPSRMPFGLCNAPSTYQWCMTNVFSDLLQDYMKVFMDDFTMYTTSFDACLGNLSKLLTRCIDTNLVLNFEKCHFMVTKVLRSKNPKSTLSLLFLTPLLWEVRSFLGHVVLYRRFVKNFNRIALSLSTMLQKDVNFNFEQPCVEAF